MNAVRALLGGIVDYAGLFPPAALDMRTAVRNYASYLTELDAWMLGRFVVPVARLDEFAAERGAVDSNGVWRLTALLGADPERDLATVRAFNHRSTGVATIDSLEVKLASAEEIERVARLAAGEFDLYVELSLEVDPRPLIAAVAKAGARAKIRTGGVTPAAFPPATDVVRFIRACLDAQVPFKATAGLHHPVRAEYRLTYEPNAATGMMFGYLNVFLASALMTEGLSDADAVRLLEERDPAAFEMADDSLAWRGHSLTADAAARARHDVALSFGSCSFREPVDELHALTVS